MIHIQRALASAPFAVSLKREFFLAITNGFTSKMKHTTDLPAYSVANEVSLRRFLEDGEILIDNSASERDIRSFTVARKT